MESKNNYFTIIRIIIYAVLGKYALCLWAGVKLLWTIAANKGWIKPKNTVLWKSLEFILGKSKTLSKLLKKILRHVWNNSDLSWLDYVKNIFDL